MKKRAIEVHRNFACLRFIILMFINRLARVPHMIKGIAKVLTGA